MGSGIRDQDLGVRHVAFIVCSSDPFIYLFIFSLESFYLFILLYNIVLVLPYIDMNPPRVYMCSPSRTPLPPPSPYHPSGSSQCTSPKRPVSCIEPRLAIHFLYDIIHVSMPLLPNHPTLSLSHRVQKTVLYICVSFAVSHTGLSLPSFYIPYIYDQFSSVQSLSRVRLFATL